MAARLWVDGSGESLAASGSTALVIRGHLANPGRGRRLLAVAIHKINSGKRAPWKALYRAARVIHTQRVRLPTTLTFLPLGRHMFASLVISILVGVIADGVPPRRSQ